MEILTKKELVMEHILFPNFGVEEKRKVKREQPLQILYQLSLCVPNKELILFSEEFKCLEKPRRKCVKFILEMCCKKTILEKINMNGYSESLPKKCSDLIGIFLHECSCPPLRWIRESMVLMYLALEDYEKMELMRMFHNSSYFNEFIEEINYFKENFHLLPRTLNSSNISSKSLSSLILFMH